MRNLESHKHFYNLKVKGGFIVATTKADFHYLIRNMERAEYSTTAVVRPIKVGDDDGVRVDHVHTLSV